ncbi:MAG: right-handed parallel beta-helix repeat-containing protein [Actinomycetota bacterium]
MSPARHLFALLVGAGLLIMMGLAGRPTTTITVPAGAATQLFLDAVPEGSTVRLAPGVHRGPLTVDKTLTLIGEEGARIDAPVDSDAALHVTARDVRISNLQVSGGWTGIDLDDAEGSVVKDVRVTGADLQGIRVYKASALVDSVSVSGLVDPHAQGIEVLSAPDVVVRNSQVTGGKIGIVAHLSDSLFEDNRVSGTSMVGLMIREMGRGIARDNDVTNASGAGLYCGDMALCAFEHNRVERVSAATNARSSAGWGLVVNYRATASTKRDVLSGEAGSAVALSHSRLVEESPLRLGEGAAAIWPGSLATLVGLAVIGLLYLAARRLMPSGISPRTYAGAAAAGTALLLVGVGVQSFHMLEHVIQFYRVHMEGVPSRGALVGSVVDTEWVHFTYNALVLGGLVALLVLRRRGWTPSGMNPAVGDRLILASALLQGYHVVEHSLKVTQHVLTEAKVNPGLLGNHFDLVLLHFGLNAAIYLAFIAGAIAYLWPRRGFRDALVARRSEPRPT